MALMPQQFKEQYFWLNVFAVKSAPHWRHCFIALDLKASVLAAPLLRQLREQ